MKTMKVMRKLMMTVALGATMFAVRAGFGATPPDYLSFTARNGDVNIKLYWGYGSADERVFFERTFDPNAADGAWIPFSGGSNFVLRADQTVYFRKQGAEVATCIAGDNFTWHQFEMASENPAAVVDAGGNVMSLMDRSCQSLEVGGIGFQRLFWDCTLLRTAPRLPATELGYMSYFMMFDGCTALTAAPDLPAVNLGDYCYVSMFSGCTNLQSISVGFKSWSETGTSNWLEDVAPTGTFTGTPGLDLPEERGANTIPEGWTFTTGGSPDNPWNVSQPGAITVFAYTNGVGGLVVYGNGPVRDNDDYDIPWQNFSDEITSLTIGKGVTAIGKNAFEYLTSLSEITFEEGSALCDIGDYAFCYAAQRVTELNLPPALETIGEQAFGLCNPDLKIRIPAKVSEMGSFAFATTRNNQTYCGVREMIFENGTSPIPLATFARESLTAFPKKLKVVIAGETGVPEQWRGNDGLLYATPKAAAAAGCATITAVPPLVNRETATVGEYAKFPFEDLGIPVDTNKYTIKVEGLPKGLKFVAEQIKNQKKKVVGYNYFIEGVPTETLAFATQKAYVRLTNADKTQTLYPLMLEVEPDEPVLVYEGGIVGKALGEYVRQIFPQADATWTYKGWPTGLKYTTKPVKDKTLGEIPAYAVYGTFTKAGRFTVTATAPVPGTKYKNTYTAILTVWPDQNARSQKDRFTHQAYAPFEPMMAGDVKSISGLPPGLKHTLKTLTDKTFGEIPGGTIYGMPTKAGVYTVTAKTFDGKSSSILWTIPPPDAPTFALDMGTAPVEDMKAQIVQGANQSFAIAASEGAKVSVSGLPSGLKLVQDKTTKTYTVQGVATKPGEYVVTFKTVLNGVTTVTTTAFTVKGNPFTATYRGYAYARPADGAAYRLAAAEVTVAAAGTVKLTYTEGKTKYTASVKSFDWDDATGKGTAGGLVLKVSSADKQLGYGDRKATVTFEDRGAYLKAKLSIADANGTGLSSGVPPLFETAKTTEVPLPASQTFVFRAVDGGPLATVSVAYDAKKATAAFSGKLYDGTAVKATVPVTRWDDDGDSADYVFAPFLVIAKDGTVYCFDGFSSGLGFVDVVDETGELPNNVCVDSVDYTLGDKKFAELMPATGAFTFGWGSDAEIVGVDTESFTFAVTLDKNKKPAGVAIYDADPQPGEKALATVTAKVGKTTGAISVSFTSKKGDKAKYAVELVWRGDKLFAGHVTRTWKGVVGNKSANLTAYGTAEVK